MLHKPPVPVLHDSIPFVTHCSSAKTAAHAIVWMPDAAVFEDDETSGEARRAVGTWLRASRRAVDLVLKLVLWLARDRRGFVDVDLSFRGFAGESNDESALS